MQPHANCVILGKAILVPGSCDCAILGKAILIPASCQEHSPPQLSAGLQTDRLERLPSDIMSCSVIYKAGLQAELTSAKKEELITDQYDPTRVRPGSHGPSQDWPGLVHLP